MSTVGVSGRHSWLSFLSVLLKAASSGLVPIML